MKDDPKFNILFVKEVEKHPELYNSTVHGYVNKQEQEHHWRLVAEALNESSANCKEKWKNVRSSLCRHLRNQYTYGPGMRCKKSYYLAKHMEFLIPYIKIRQPGQYTTVADIVKDESSCITDIVKEEELPDGDNEYDFTPEMEMTEDEDTYTPHENDEVHHDLPSSIRSPFPNVISPVQELHEYPVKKQKVEGSNYYNRMAQEYFVLRSKLDSQPEDSDLLFLKSLLPDVHKMNDKQKNKFRIMVLNGIDTILYSNDAPGTRAFTTSKSPLCQSCLAEPPDNKNQG